MFLSLKTDIMKYVNINEVFSMEEVKPSSGRKKINLSFLIDTRMCVCVCVHVHKDGHVSSQSIVKTHALSFMVFLNLKGETGKVALLPCCATLSNISDETSFGQDHLCHWGYCKYH